MTTAPTTTRTVSGAPLREVGEGPPSRDSRTSVVAVVAFLLALVLLPLTQVVPPGALVAGVVLWAVLRLGDRISGHRSPGARRPGS